MKTRTECENQLRTQSRRLSAITAAILLVAGTVQTTPGAPGDVDPTFDPGSGICGSVNALAVQGDGKALVGGSFHTVHDALRNNIARFNSDGSNDDTFQNGLAGVRGGEIGAFAVQADGRILIGGKFTTVNGVARNYLARLNADGSLDPSFLSGLTGPNSYVSGIGVQPDGKVVIRGGFTSVNGVARSILARLNPDGSLDPACEVTLQGWNIFIEAMKVQSDGKIVIGGNFTGVNGVARTNLARLNADGTVEPLFLNGASGADGYVKCLVVQGDGRIVIGGEFSQCNGMPRNRIARLNPDGAVDTTFLNGLSGVDGIVYCLDLQDDKVVIGGSFAVVNGATRYDVARLNPDGSVDSGFKGMDGPSNDIGIMAAQTDGQVLIAGGVVPGLARVKSNGDLDPAYPSGPSGPNGFLRSLAPLDDGRVIIAGTFDRISGSQRSSIARLKADGSVDETFINGAGPWGAYGLVLQPDRKLLFWGPYANLKRANADGSLDSTFLKGLAGPNSVVQALALQPDGLMVIGGQFTSVNGVARSGLARLEVNGALDKSFSAGVTGSLAQVSVLALQRDGKVLVGGWFTAINSVDRPYLARLNSNGSLDQTFMAGLAGPNAGPGCLAVQSDGKIVVGGNFTSFNGVPRRGFARLNPDGTLDPTFFEALQADGTVYCLSLQREAKILIGGDFASVNGVPRASMARLNADGTLDATFSGGANGHVATLSQQPDGRILAGGGFTAVNQTARNFVVRFLGDYVDPPVIVEAPASRTVGIGSTVQFSVRAIGFTPLAYQWWFNVTNMLADATNSVLSLTDVQSANEGAYGVVVTNLCGSATSPPAILTVLATPTLVSSPTNQMALIGSTMEFPVAAMGSPPLAYQWFFNGTNALPGATNATLRLVDAQPSQAGAYSIVVTNAYGAVTSVPAVLAFYPPGTVLVDSADALSAAMGVGGTIAFTYGTITLDGPITNTTDTVLDGTGRSVRLSGGWRELFYVSTNTSLTLVNLTIADGMGRGPIGPPEPRGSGGAVIIDGGTLNVHHTTFMANQAASGGAILNQGGTLNLFDSRFATNQAANGGAILNQGGVINAVNCVFAGNLGQQPQPHITASIEGHGGAILNGSGSVVLQDCLFTGNRAQGTSPLELLVRAAGAFGGAIENLGTLTVIRCIFSQNVASGANGFDNNYSPGGSSTSGGSGSGGAICSPGPLAVESSTFLSNTVTGGNGPPGATGARGTFGSTIGPGGNGGSGGSANGGAICVNGTGYAVNSTFAYNIAVGGTGGGGGGGGSSDLHGLSGANGGAGGAGGSAFGGLYGGIRLTNCTLAFNAATARSGGRGGLGGAGIPPGVNGLPGPNGFDGVAGGAMTEGVCVNTLLAGNAPGGNCRGGVEDGGHNLSSDASCLFTNVGSFHNTDPRLALLANNGGPTPTIALLPGSPAIDAGDTTAAPPTDQRGFLRPIGPAADIGAFEYGAPAYLQIGRATGNGMDVLVWGVSGQSCRLLISSDMANWIPIATNQIGPNGTGLIHEVSGGETQRFYRVLMP